MPIKLKQLILRPYLGAKVSYLPSEDKCGIVTVRVIDEKEKEYNIGIQIIDGIYFQEKVLLFGANTHGCQTDFDDHNNITKTATINILDFNGFSTPSYHKVITFGCKYENSVKTIDELVFHVLELPNYKQKAPESKEEEWLQYLKGDNEDMIEKIKQNNPAIKKLDEKLQEYWSKETI